MSVVDVPLDWYLACTICYLDVDRYYTKFVENWLKCQWPCIYTERNVLKQIKIYVSNLLEDKNEILK